MHGLPQVFNIILLTFIGLIHLLLVKMPRFAPYQTPCWQIANIQTWTQEFSSVSVEGGIQFQVLGFPKITPGLRSFQNNINYLSQDLNDFRCTFVKFILVHLIVIDFGPLFSPQHVCTLLGQTCIEKLGRDRFTGPRS